MTPVHFPHFQSIGQQLARSRNAHLHSRSAEQLGLAVPEHGSGERRTAAVVPDRVIVTGEGTTGLGSGDTRRAAVPDADGGWTDEASELQLPRRAEKGISAPSVLHLSPFVF